MAWGQGSPSANQHLPSAAATAVTRAERTGKCLAVRAPELVVQPSVQMLRRHRRSLLRCLERTHQPAMEDHVSRRTLMGSHRSTNLRIGIRRDSLEGLQASTEIVGIDEVTELPLQLCVARWSMDDRSW